MTQMSQYDAIKSVLDQDQRVIDLNERTRWDLFDGDENYELAYYNELSALYKTILVELFWNKTH